MKSVSYTHLDVYKRQEYISQGDANLDGAVYGLYAAEDIRHPNGKSEDVHKKDELVAQDTIQDGKADFTNLYLGNYYVKEISPGEGLSLIHIYLSGRYRRRRRIDRFGRHVGRNIRSTLKRAVTISCVMALEKQI